MIDIKFEINGRRIGPNQMGNALESAILQSVKDKIMSRISSIRDPKTGAPPKIRVRGCSIDNLAFEVEGSEEVVQLVKEMLE